ncbi:hypothetical protein [Granulicella sp. S156]|uniref:hypothetical protein n=1 Tax=Granulicella sp. S156 TaxID=1747224 RepID=UPI00131BA50D|nr:hypothetical protein [Granulicella sp. S156]
MFAMDDGGGEGGGDGGNAGNAGNGGNAGGNGDNSGNGANPGNGSDPGNGADPGNGSDPGNGGDPGNNSDTGNGTDQNTNTGTGTGDFSPGVDVASSALGMTGNQGIATDFSMNIFAPAQPDGLIPSANQGQQAGSPGDNATAGSPSPTDQSPKGDNPVGDDQFKDPTVSPAPGNQSSIEGFPAKIDPSTYLSQGSPGPSLRAASGNDRSVGQINADFQRSQDEATAELTIEGAKQAFDKLKDMAYEAAKDAIYKELGPIIAAGTLVGIKTAVKYTEASAGVVLGLLDSTETASPSLDERPASNNPYGNSIGSERAPR